MKLFNFDVHIGKWLVLVQTRDIADEAVTSSKIAKRAIQWWHIALRAIRNEHIADEAVDARTLAKGAVKGRHIADGGIPHRKFSPEVEEYFNQLLNEKCRCMQKQMDELRQLVTSYTAHGVALSRCFGPNDDIGVTQRSLTNEITRIWNKFNELTGEPGKSIHVEITPDVFVTETFADVQVKAVAGDEIFERIRIYVNDELAIDREMTEGFIGHLTLSETSCVRTVAQILGREYTDIQIVTKLFPFFIGSGTEWQEAMTVEDAQVYRGKLAGSYDMKVKQENDHIYVIVPTRLAHQMIRIDMNGIEVPTIIKQRGELTIFESVNVYQQGSYNIDISDNCQCDCDGDDTENTDEEG